MVVIPAGSFMMGSPPSEFGRFYNEKVPSTGSPFNNDFAIGKFPITRGEYARFLAESKYDADDYWKNSNVLQEDNYAAGNISWDDASAYAKWLSEKTGYEYRLPSEAEYEYAERAGTTTANWWGNDSGSVCSRVKCNHGGIGQSGNIRQIPLDCMTWQEMSRNGPKTAGTTTTMARQPMERLGRKDGVVVMPFVAEEEVTKRGFTGLPYAKDICPMTAIGFLAFAWPGDSRADLVRRADVLFPCSTRAVGSFANLSAPSSANATTPGTGSCDKCSAKLEYASVARLRFPNDFHAYWWVDDSEGSEMGQCEPANRNRAGQLRGGHQL